MTKVLKILVLNFVFIGLVKGNSTKSDKIQNGLVSLWNDSPLSETILEDSSQDKLLKKNIESVITNSLKKSNIKSRENILFLKNSKILVSKLINLLKKDLDRPEALVSNLELLFDLHFDRSKPSLVNLIKALRKLSTPLTADSELALLSEFNKAITPFLLKFLRPLVSSFYESKVSPSSFSVADFLTFYRNPSSPSLPTEATDLIIPTKRNSLATPTPEVEEGEGEQLYIETETTNSPYGDGVPDLHEKSLLGDPKQEKEEKQEVKEDSVKEEKPEVKVEEDEVKEDQVQDEPEETTDDTVEETQPDEDQDLVPEEALSPIQTFLARLLAKVAELDSKPPEETDTKDDGKRYESEKLTQEEINKIENVIDLGMQLKREDVKGFNFEELEDAFGKEKEPTKEEVEKKQKLLADKEAEWVREINAKFQFLNEIYIFKINNPKDTRNFYFELYVPKVGDHIIGTVTAKNVDYYTVTINNLYQGYLMCIEGFRGATKKNRPHINTGEAVFCQVLAIHNPNLIELTCVNNDDLKGFSTNETYFGKLNGGFLISINTSFAEILYKYECYILRLLSNLRYQLVIGFNGKLWVNNDDVKNILKIVRFIKLSYGLNKAQISQLQAKIFE